MGSCTSSASPHLPVENRTSHAPGRLRGGGFRGSPPKVTYDVDPENNEEIPTIEVRDDRLISHRVVRRIEHSISRKPLDERGILGTRQGRNVPLNISAGALPRALRILDAFFAAG
jgi:hypothetical protein